MGMADTPVQVQLATGEPHWRRTIARGTIALGLIASVVAIAGIFSRLGWRCNIPGQFRRQFFWTLARLATVLFTMGLRRWGAFLAILVAVLFCQLTPYYARRPDIAADWPRLRIVTWNVSSENHRYDEALRFIRDTAADVVVIEEVDDGW